MNCTSGLRRKTFRATPTGSATPLEIQQNKIHVDCQHMGGGFGSKFDFDQMGHDRRVALKADGPAGEADARPRPGVMIAGNRPSAFAKIKVGAKKDGTIDRRRSRSLGHRWESGLQPAEPVPYVFTKIPNTKSVDR